MVDKEQKFIDYTDILSKELMPDRLAAFKKMAEKINKIFGWNITVDKGEIVKQEDEVIDSNVKEEIAEGNDGNNDKNVSRETTEDGETDD